MSDWLTILSAWLAAGTGAGGGFFVIKWVFEYIGGRMDRRAEALDAGTQQLINNLQNRLTTVEARLDKAETELAECRAKHATSEAEVARLKSHVETYERRRERRVTD